MRGGVSGPPTNSEVPMLDSADIICTSVVVMSNAAMGSVFARCASECMERSVSNAEFVRPSADCWVMRAFVDV